MERFSFLSFFISIEAQAGIIKNHLEGYQQQVPNVEQDHHAHHHHRHHHHHQEEESVSEAAGLGNPSPFLFLPPALCDVTVSITIIILHYPVLCGVTVISTTIIITPWPLPLSIFDLLKETVQHKKRVLSFDPQATSMMYVGLTMTSAAQFQMLRGRLDSIAVSLFTIRETAMLSEVDSTSIAVSLFLDWLSLSKNLMLSRLDKPVQLD